MDAEETCPLPQIDTHGGWGGGVGGASAPVLPMGSLAFSARDLESLPQLAMSKIQAACSLMHAQLDSGLPFARMLDKGQTTAWVKAHPEDIVCPNNSLSLESAVHL
jgi:hypothetical protein